MTNNQIHYMVEIAKAGSVNQAARNLFISQSSLSGAIQSVEAEFGRKIFARSVKGMALTPFGRQFIAYIIGICVAFFGGAALTYVVGFEDDPLPGSKAPKTAPKAVTAGDVVLSAPVEGTVIPASDIKDEVFASGALGKGIGVIPTSGDVVAPADCTVELVYETKHALGLNVNGVEVLLHIGVNTVDLQGKYFETFVENGQKVKKGQKLVHFDLDALKKAGYDTTVAMLVSNADDLGGVSVATEGPAVISVVR